MSRTRQFAQLSKNSEHIENTLNARTQVRLTDSSSSFTAMAEDMAGDISTSSGFTCVPEHSLPQSVINFPECCSFKKVPTRFDLQYCSKKRGSASLAISLPFAWTKSLRGATPSAFSIWERIFPESKQRLEF